jgi:SAM-dependent methyltransferase
MNKVAFGTLHCNTKPEEPEHKVLSLKKRVGSMIPYPAIALGRKVIHFGPNRCEVCGTATRTRLDSGYGFPVLEELQVVGGLKRRKDLCPVCHSGSRERLIWFYLTRHQGAFRNRAPAFTVAHFAPEKGLSIELRKRFANGYTAYDLAPHRYRHMTDVQQQNLEALTLGDNSVDLLVANHIMEHVYDLPKALSEVRRVLKPGSGLAIMQVPIALKLEEHRDDGQAMGPQERIDLFGQDDHVRLFTPRSYRESLEQAGFAVSEFEAFADDSALATEWELDPFETLLLIRDPA